MRIEQISGPSAEPVTLSQVKDHLRVDTSPEDLLLTDLISAARDMVEAETRRRLITQSVRVIYDGFGAHGMILPVAPVQSIDQVQHLDNDGNWATVSASDYRMVSSALPSELWPEYAKTWPTPRAVPANVRVDLTVGYGASASDIPGALRQALLVTIAHLYELREPVVTGAISTELPRGVAHWLSQYRLWV